MPDARASRDDMNPNRVQRCRAEAFPRAIGEMESQLAGTRRSKPQTKRRERKTLSGIAQPPPRLRRTRNNSTADAFFRPIAEAFRHRLRTRLKGSDQALSRSESRALKSVACGSPPRRAYRP
jgi:hypothetical protein